MTTVNSNTSVKEDSTFLKFTLTTRSMDIAAADCTDAIVEISFIRGITHDTSYK